jgi:hypothetical protein
MTETRTNRVGNRDYQVVFRDGEPSLIRVCCQPKGANYAYSFRIIWETGRPIKGIAARVLQETKQ